MKKLLAVVMSLAIVLAYTPMPSFADEGVFSVNGNSYETFTDALSNADAGDTIEINKAGTYTVPGLGKNVTIKGSVSDVIFNCDGTGSIASIPNGATFENVTMNFGSNNYHGFQHAGTINMNGCTLNGLLFTYGDMNFNKCTFNAPGSEYCMWTYGKDLTFTDCTFNGAGKFLNVYCEANAVAYNITATGCKFISSKTNKAAFNVKETSGANVLKYNVKISDCTCNENFPAASENGSLKILSPLVQVDDRILDGTPSGGEIKISQDGKILYESEKKFGEDENGTYHIKTAQQLVKFGKLVNDGIAASKNAVLEADIDLDGVDFTSIGTSAKPFGGMFDGNGKTISNLNISSTESGTGLFGYIQVATIKNLIVKNASVKSTGEYAGIIAGHAHATVENCTVAGGSVEGAEEAGGIVGSYYGAGSISGCTVDGVTIKATDNRAGGITAKASATEGYIISGNTVKNCSISSANRKDGLLAAAGLIGQIMTDGAYSIKDNMVADTATATGSDTTFVPIGEFRSGNFDANAVAGEKIVNNSWEPVTKPNYYDLVNASNTSQSVRINNANLEKVAKIGDKEFTSLAEAFAAASAGQTVEIILEGEYKLPAVDKNIILKSSIDNVVIDATGSGNICAIPNGVTFENMTFNFGSNNYHGFQHAGTINMNNCTLNGLLFTYGDMNFNNCTFNASGSEYCMWTYGKDLTFTDCTFNGAGKFLNVYCESNTAAYNITATRCKFISSKTNKAAFNVKETSGANVLKYNVNISDCTCNENFPAASENDRLKILSPLVQVDDRLLDGTPKGSEILVTLDGKQVYKSPRAFVPDEDNFYHIETAAQLVEFANLINSGKNFNAILEDDIDLKDLAFTPIGDNDKVFNGTFDGNGKTISNAAIASSTNYTGLFGHVFGAKIKNLTVKDAKVKSTGENYTGIIAGGGYADIEGCSVIGGTVEGTDQVGGIIGYLSCGSVKDSKVDGAAIKANGDRAGGITGKANPDSQYEISGNTVNKCTISAAKACDGLASAAGIAGQIMTGSSYCIKDNKVSDTTTATGSDKTFVPVGEFRKGSFDPDAVTGEKIVNNSWTPGTTPDSYNMVDAGDTSIFVEIRNAAWLENMEDVIADLLVQVQENTNAIAALDDTYATDADVADKIAAAKKTIEEAQKKIDEAQDAKEKADIQAVKDDITAAKEALEKSDAEILSASKAYTDVAKEALQKAIDDNKKAISALDDTYATDADVADKIAAAKKAIEDAQKAVNDVQDADIAALVKSIADAETALKKADQDTLNLAKAYTDGTAASMQRDINDLKDTIDALNNTYATDADVDNKIAAAKKAIEEAQKVLNDAQNEKEASDIAALVQSIADLKTTFAAADKKTESAAKAYTDVVRKNLQDQIDALDSNGVTDAELADIKAAIVKAQKAIDSVQNTKIDSATTLINQLRLKVEQLIQKADNALTAKIENLQDKNAVLTSDMAALKKQIAYMKLQQASLKQLQEEMKRQQYQDKIDAVTINLTAKAKSYNSVKLTWNTSKAKVNNKAITYKVYYKKKSAKKWKVLTTKTCKADGKNMTFTKKKLTTGKKYQFKVVPQVTVGSKKYIGADSNEPTVKPVPAKATIKKLKSGKKKFTVTSKKVAGASGYQIKYRRVSMNKVVKKTAEGTKKTVKKLKAKKRYAVNVRAYKKVSGKKVYGAWSKTKYVTVR